ncbi:Aste57867_14150 [Aphanomyces stellatus]|uniref:Aste57867_14150 protein n=1 Tax=Aphanomyces stellatus TaxID=120398 RepID=A0A485L098_9STRA|nr:hypothetical protein As57867_014099 [Aphanomyces stellatus]VFT90976.1 Aste57867_14150 [Aphanomyces stellatus]
MKTSTFALAAVASLAVAQNSSSTTLTACTQEVFSSVNAAWTSDSGAKCLKGLGISLADLGKGSISAAVLAKGDKAPDCLDALELQDSIIDVVTTKSGDCSVSSTLSLYATTFHDENGFLTGWANVLKGLKGIDVTKTDATILASVMSDVFPDCTQDDFNLVDAAWATDSGANCLTALGVTLSDLATGKVAADVLATADTNDDCKQVIDYQGQVVDFILDTSGDCKVSDTLTLYKLSWQTFSQWAGVVKTLKGIDVSATATSAPPTFADVRAAPTNATSALTDGSSSSGVTAPTSAPSAGSTPTTTAKSSASMASVAAAAVVALCALVA